MLKSNILIITGLIIFLLPISGVTNFAHAQDFGWYGAVTVGEGEVSVNEFDTSSTTSIYFGNRFDDNAAFEFGYIDLGEFDLEDVSDTFIEGTGFEFSVLGLFQVGESADIFGKVGLFLWETEGKFLGLSVEGDDGNSLLLGIGANIPFSQSVGLRLEAVDYLDINDEDVLNLSIGLFVKF